MDPLSASNARPARGASSRPCSGSAPNIADQSRPAITGWAACLSRNRDASIRKIREGAAGLSPRLVSSPATAATFGTFMAPTASIQKYNCPPRRRLARRAMRPLGGGRPEAPRPRLHASAVASWPQTTNGMHGAAAAGIPPCIPPPCIPPPSKASDPAHFPNILSPSQAPRHPKNTAPRRVAVASPGRLRNSSRASPPRQQAISVAPAMATVGPRTTPHDGPAAHPNGRVEGRGRSTEAAGTEGRSIGAGRTRGAPCRGAACSRLHLVLVRTSGHFPTPSATDIGPPTWQLL